ncbi:WD40-repeat-containing domain protein [Coemansia spiralis]|nr:WD40-repeat-containing domain protein [Coemansia spiralis]
MDSPPGELTILKYPSRSPAKVADPYKECAFYDVVPTMALINAYQIHAVSATSNMRWIFTGGEDGYIRKWDFNSTVNGKQLLTQGQRHPYVDSVTKAGIMASYWDHSDLVEGGVEMLSPIYSLDVHSQALWLVSGMKSGHIGLWTVRHDEGRRITLLTKHKKPVSVLKITPDEFGLVSGSWDRAVLYWDLNCGKIARGFAGHTSQISSIDTTSPVLMTTSIDGQCLLWDVRAPKTLPHHFNTPLKTPPWATSACWSVDGKRIYIGRRNNTVDEYEFGMGSQPVNTLRLPMNSGPITAVAALANGKSLICASTDNVRMWNLDHQPDKRGAIPFQIIPGHHGGMVSNVLVDEASQYMVTTSGSRGWEGTSNNVFLGYEINPFSQ